MNDYLSGYILGLALGIALGIIVIAPALRESRARHEAREEANARRVIEDALEAHDRMAEYRETERVAQMAAHTAYMAAKEATTSKPAA